MTQVTTKYVISLQVRPPTPPPTVVDRSWCRPRWLIYSTIEIRHQHLSTTAHGKTHAPTTVFWFLFSSWLLYKLSVGAPIFCVTWPTRPSRFLSVNISGTTKAYLKPELKNYREIWNSDCILAWTNFPFYKTVFGPIIFKNITGNRRKSVFLWKVLGMIFLKSFWSFSKWKLKFDSDQM